MRMLYSMTGFGRQQLVIEDEKYEIEIRSLNSKTSEVRLKLTPSLREREIPLRNLILDKALRGKIEVSIYTEKENGDSQDAINEIVFEKYYKTLKGLQVKLGAKNEPLFSAILALPNTLEQKKVTLSEAAIRSIDEAVIAAVEQLMNFRLSEGTNLAADLKENIQNITALLTSVDAHEATRIESIKFRIQNNFKKHLNELPTDGNRFEQEVIYYLEKLDINEEKVRLAQHCTYFLETLENAEQPKGKKLNFIAQEIGREINTLGAKAYQSDIQKVVVQMKDNLEKIKEQIANVL